MIEPKQEETTSSGTTGIHLLFGDIDNSTSKEVCSWILEANFSSGKKHDTLNLIINSSGGTLSDAYAIIDVMKSSHIPIRTIGLGEIQSAALMIFLSGSKGERILSKNTSIMSHQYSCGNQGKHHELISANKEFKLAISRMTDHYKEHTGLSEKDITKFLLPSHDVFLSADEALQLGICDSIAWSNR